VKTRNKQETSRPADCAGTALPEGKLLTENDGATSANHQPPPVPCSLTPVLSPGCFALLQELEARRPPAVLRPGGNFNLLPPKRPETLGEAGELARGMLGKYSQPSS